MKALLKAAGLEEGVVGIDMRPGGKVLISLTSLDMARACIRNFHDPQWAASGQSLNALYVRTVKRQETVAKGHTFSVDAPVFVPSKTLSADASVFVPAAVKNDGERARVDSDASTDANPLSDG